MGLFFGLNSFLFGDKISQNCSASATSYSLIGANSAFLSMSLWAGSLPPMLLDSNRTEPFLPRERYGPIDEPFSILLLAIYARGIDLRSPRVFGLDRE
jgi:hypothetical protein